MKEYEDKIWCEARAYMSMLDQVRAHWIEVQDLLTVEEQAEFWQYFSSVERRFAKDDRTGLYKPAKRTL